MLDTTDEILLEQFITYNFMSMDTRDLCVHLIRNIKEIKSSNFVAHKYDNNSFNIVGLSLEKLKLFFLLSEIALSKSFFRKPKLFFSNICSSTLFSKSTVYPLYIELSLHLNIYAKYFIF